MTDEEYFVGHCKIGWEKKTVALRTFYKLDLAGTYIINIFKSLFRFFFFQFFRLNSALIENSFRCSMIVRNPNIEKGWYF